MIIVFEGTDKSGKTTLAKELAKQTKMSLFIPPRLQHYKDADGAATYYQGVNDSVFAVAKIFDDFIIDRFFISDFVYSLVFGRTQNIDAATVASLDRKVLVIHTEASYRDQVERGLAPSKNYFEEDMDLQKHLFSHYWEINGKHFGKNFHHINLNTSKMDVKECMARIKIAIQEFKKL